MLVDGRSLAQQAIVSVSCASKQHACVLPSGPAERAFILSETPDGAEASYSEAPCSWRRRAVFGVTGGDAGSAALAVPESSELDELV